MPELDDETKKLLSKVSSSETPSKLWSLLSATLAQHGISMASYHLYDLGAGSLQTVAYGHPKEFEKDYIQKKWGKVDPIHQYAVANGIPFRWRDIRKLAKLTEEQERFLFVAKEAGLRDGLAFGVFGPKLRNGFVGLGFGPGTPEPSDELATAFQLLCQAGHNRYCEIVDESRNVKLSPRENETLKWMAVGKSNSDIATILSVSPHTVDTHVRRIYAKLDVSDRTTAAIKGLGTGVLHCSNLVA